MKTLGELSNVIDAKLIGAADKQISDARSLQTAQQNHLTFATEEKHLERFLASECESVIVSSTVPLPIQTDKRNFLVVDEAKQSFTEVVKLFRPIHVRKRIGISERAFVSESAEIAEDVDIFPGAFIGDKVRIGCGTIIHPNVTVLDNVEIGTNTVLFPGVTVYENCIIGNRCILHSGSIIGAYGFGYNSSDIHELAAQLGNVVIGDDVEIGSNSTIDRGSFDSTTIGNGTKLDNLVMIGHNCQIGNHNLLCAQVGIAGSCLTGDYVVMAGQVGVGDHLEIGDKATLAAQSGIMHDIATGQTYLGTPAMPARKQMQIVAISSKLPEMWKSLKKLKKQMDRPSATLSVDEAA